MQGLGVLDEGGDALGSTSLAGRPAVPSRIPRKDRHVVHAKRIDHVLPASAVFVAAVEEHYGTPAFASR